MDGTIYLGNNLLPYAHELFDYLNDNKIEYVFLTNNSSSNKETYLKKITRLGLLATDKNFYSSIDHSISYLKQRKIKNIYFLGVKEFEKILINEGFQLIDGYEKGAADIVLVGFDKTLTYEKLMNASLYIQDNIEVIASHPDKRCPIEGGKSIPDCGAILDLLESTSKISKLTILGKPHPDMILNLLNERKIDARDALIIGDRHYTDVLCGVNAKVDSGLILTGESQIEDLEGLDYKPTHIFKNLKDVLDYLKNI